MCPVTGTAAAVGTVAATSAASAAAASAAAAAAAATTAAAAATATAAAAAASATAGLSAAAVTSAAAGVGMFGGMAATGVSAVSGLTAVGASMVGGTAASTGIIAGMSGFQLASLGMSAMSGIMGMMGQRQQGRAAQARATYQAAVDRNNAIRSNQKAARARTIGESQRVARLLGATQDAGRINVGLAANGVVVNAGTALALKSDALDAGFQDARMIAHNAEVDALSYEADAGNHQAQARLTTMRGAADNQAGKRAAFSTALSTAGRVSNQWYGFDRANQGLA